ncbi:MAG: hypothetical protein JWO72_1850 [Caulobacteraceae bacterium]|nr:hypothetical protein [Caulobacteraceae bacterium]
MNDFEQFDVAIVGGGIAGLSLSMFLKQQGIGSVILEKSHRTGGKAWSLNLEGNLIEMGACYLARDYQEVAALAHAFGVGTRRLGESDAEPGSIVGRFYKATIPGRLAQAAGLLWNLQRYARRRRKALARFEAKDRATCAALAAPAAEWLASEGCQGLQALFVLLIDRFGYGPMISIPALYALRWMTPALIMTAILRDTRQLDAGFGEVTRRMAEAADVRLESPLTAAVREGDGRWRISTCNGDIVVRDVAVACAPGAPELLELFDVNRRGVLQHNSRSTLYGCALVTARNWFETDQRACMKDGDHRDQLLAVRREGPSASGAAYYACYLYPSTADPAHIEQVLRRELQVRGAELVDILEIHCATDYLTHIDSAAIASGRYFELEDGQGHDNVWLCNSLLAHENWRDLLVLSRKTADQIARSRPTPQHTGPARR